ncbi:uncharacterized protein PGTG_01428 [Puccinia graminis f. sp. tritici CRL 75-36-700-3]|uniref:tRNA (guanine(10)-N(2))-methyltransferase n=1 Tax=Puccinia graminis f. sp. tritici (strain CRL 75-36-700-3 / race SCCL) TaxID=418459 RepID=E3JS10_PUCGT|nr:uncharacterized protein PGTG_01428 [Puccinia graminis f. sp. tritici CRL 75-36-700-3]EFP74835.2 hypothetical protein PGTG_01428 [Puccinia graminis f. sp. tritici CRL 75-36-700-3]
MAPQIYIIIFAQAYEEFRLPELESIDVLFNLGIDYLGLELDIYRPYMKIGLENDEKARLLGSRAVLIKHILRHWADAPSYPELHRLNKENEALWADYAASHTFKVTVNSYKTTVTQGRKKELIESLSYMDFRGTINLQDPQVEIMLSEEHYSADGPDDNAPAIGIDQVLRMTNIRLRWIWLGLKICDGQRHLVDKFDLKKRIYIGNTSMEAGLSLLMANQGLVGPGSVVNDPFTGTGSMLYASAWYGAYVFGSDIDGRPMRGKEHSIHDSARQYGVSQNLLDCAVFDMTQNPWRTGEIFDAIICDPPYGVRAGAKRLGRKDQSKIRTEPYKLPDGTWSHEKPDYVPPSKPWEMSEVLEGLLEFALRMLKPNGRLVYWLPTASQDYSHADVPQRNGLRLVANSCQDFGKWQRRLITMQKDPTTSSDDGAPQCSNSSQHNQAEESLPGHRHFRDKYMKGFS